MNQRFLFKLFGCAGIIALLLSACAAHNGQQSQEQNAAKSSTGLDPANFQTTLDGKQTDLYTLENSRGMKVAITNYGGRIVSWMVPDRQGNYEDVVLGFDSIQGYLHANEIYFGALVGRYANRIAKGTFSLDGKTYHLPINNGQNTLHGGPGGFPNIVWNAKQLDDHNLRLTCSSEDMDQGFPGDMQVQVIYTLTDDNKLRIDYTAVTDKKTVINLTNHAFFNLQGAGNGSILDHELMINADAYTPIDSTMIPTGKIASVKGTPFDFTSYKKVGKDIKADNQQLGYGRGYDHNFVLNKPEPGKLSLAVKVYEPKSGRLLKIFTTEPGVQLYSGNFLDGSDVGKQDKPYKHRTALVFEPQHFPDSPNQPDFPSTVLKPQDFYHTLSVYEFGIKDK